jgi:hypothetical protein
LAKYNYNYKVKDDEMGRSCSTNGVKRNACRIFVGKAEGKRQKGRPRREWEDNTSNKMDNSDIEWGGMDLNDVALQRDQLRALVDTIRYWEICV